MCVHDIIEYVCSSKPNNIALVLGDKHISYSELNKKVDILANYLIKRGVEKGCSRVSAIYLYYLGELVILYLRRSFEMIYTILAILKVGATIVPITSDFGKERINAIIQESKAPYVVTSNDLKSIFDSEITIIDVNEALSSSNSDITFESRHIDLKSLLYVIYTSGTQLGFKSLNC